MYNILEICSYAEMADENVVDISKIKQEILNRFEEMGNKGYRILGLCYRNIDESIGDMDKSGKQCFKIDKSDEINMIFIGFLVFYDPIKSDSRASI
jgi:P-type Mg2+ transporter